MDLTASRASLLVCCLVFFTAATGQQAQQPTPEAAIRLTYTRDLGVNARLYNGPEYEDYSNTVKIGFPYFDSKNYHEGSVIFDSIHYPGLKVRFDVVKDLLMVLHPISFVSMQLQNETIAGFTIGNH